MNSSVLHDISYGVYAVTTLDGERDCGCIANSIMQITSSPATIAVSINHENFTNSCIAKSGIFAVNILPENIDKSVIGSFGFKSSRDFNKFEGMKTERKEGVAVLSAAKSYLICRVVDKLETSTHTVFLGEVIDADTLSGGEVMTYSYYHKVIKGKAPKTAPTYVEENTPKKEWKCQICGYESELSELPEDFVCPVCGVPKSLFEKI